MTNFPIFQTKLVHWQVTHCGAVHKQVPTRTQNDTGYGSSCPPNTHGLQCIHLWKNTSLRNHYGHSTSQASWWLMIGQLGFQFSREPFILSRQVPKLLTIASFRCTTCALPRPIAQDAMSEQASETWGMAGKLGEMLVVAIPKNISQPSICYDLLILGKVKNLLKLPTPKDFRLSSSQVTCGRPISYFAPWVSISTRWIRDRKTHHSESAEWKSWMAPWHSEANCFVNKFCCHWFVWDQNPEPLLPSKLWTQCCWVVQPHRLHLFP